jgi:hypothetical protein
VAGVDYVHGVCKPDWVNEGCILFLGVLIVVFLRWLGDRLEGAPPPQPVEIRIEVGLGSEEGEAWAGSSREPAP